MAVHLTRIYTKTGDTGTTALGDMTRVTKTDARIAAFADVDEANCAIGVALTLGELPPKIAEPLGVIQNDLFDVGADLCTPVHPDPAFPPMRISDSQTERLEQWCDEFNAKLPKLDSFILPGGSVGAALLHQARAITRRAERSVWALLGQAPEHTHAAP
ncbi:MAG: cob(I)yrinic acid a,c-diamide adenosyltransferase, partial [Corynebacteriales bacterium]|nr:cob(I)yrinic acid a,c-diamide adenosyltransferase [Mycobacteriales bacterium]